MAAGMALASSGGATEQQDATVVVRGGTLRMGTPSSAIPELKGRYALGFPGRTRWRDGHVVTKAVGFVGFRCVYPVGKRTP